MPIRRIKAQSPDPYLGKIQGDTELARLAHLNYVIDAINNGNGGGGSITVNGDGPVNNLVILGNASWSVSNDTATIIVNPDTPPPFKVYRAKIAMQSIDWPGYGYLYNWYAVDDVRGLANPGGGTGLTAPNQWRVPSNADWVTLETFAGGSSVAGGKLKSTLTSTAYPFYGWLINSGTDDYSFGGLGGGYRDAIGSFIAIGIAGYWWTSTSSAACCAFNYVMSNSGTVLGNFPDQKTVGKSVRLVREATASELLLNDGDTSDTSSLDPYTGNDGKTYVTVKIGTQIWLAQNLRETKYNDNSDIFNASVLFGGDVSNLTWQGKGTAQEGAWTAYLYYSGGGSFTLEYNPSIIKEFYNDVLENTLYGPGLPAWIGITDANGPLYTLTKATGLYNWNKTHIKITPGFDTDDYPTLNEKNLLIQEALSGVPSLKFRPIKRSNTGALTIEDLNNYNGINTSNTSYVYVEILEYPPAYYGSGLSVALGASNLEDEEEIVALTYEINGVTYTEDLEAKKLSIQIAKIYDQLGIFDKYKV